MGARSGWLLPLSGAFLTSAVATLVAFSSGPGCQTRCITAFDCGGGSFCLAGRCETQCKIDQDCLSPPECQGNPRACPPRGLRCNAVGRCVGQASPARSQEAGTTGPRNDFETTVEGWDDPPGSGSAFILSELKIAEEDRGFDVDGKCRGPGDCIDNALHRLGQLGNDQIRQGLLGGETLLLIELAGLDQPFRGNDKSMTVKLYGARDADDPFYPANNFQVVDGATTCCEFKINPQSLAGLNGQAASRAPARVERGLVRSLAPVTVKFTLTVGKPPHPEIRVDRVMLAGRLPANLSAFQDGLLGGAVPINTLAQTENPYCKTLNSLCQRQLPESTLIDLIATLLKPDIDLDVPLDGLELLVVGSNGRVEDCYDGCLPPSCIEAPKVDPISPDPDKRYTCALSPRMADGFSVGVRFAGVAASVVGIGD